MKTKEEINKLKEEYNALKEKLKDLTEEELKVVTGGFNVPDQQDSKDIHIYKNDVDKKQFKENFKK